MFALTAILLSLGACTASSTLSHNDMHSSGLMKGQSSLLQKPQQKTVQGQKGGEGSTGKWILIAAFVGLVIVFVVIIIDNLNGGSDESTKVVAEKYLGIDDYSGAKYTRFTVIRRRFSAKVELVEDALNQIDNVQICEVVLTKADDGRISIKDDASLDKVAESSEIQRAVDYLFPQ